jgi:hypothetical protein
MYSVLKCLLSVIYFNMQMNILFWWENLRERHRWGEPGANGRIISRRIFRKRGVGVWTGLS